MYIDAEFCYAFKYALCLHVANARNSLGVLSRDVHVLDQIIFVSWGIYISAESIIVNFIAELVMSNTERLNHVMPCIKQTRY